MSEYRADFLYPYKPESIEAAGYEFANGGTEEYRQVWWDILLERVREQATMETCICAAWKAKNGKGYRGHRHIHCLDAMGDVGTEPLTKGDMGQGFVTSTGRFVNREDGYELQVKAGIESIAEGGYRGKRLFSEDLY